MILRKLGWSLRYIGYLGHMTGIQATRDSLRFNTPPALYKDEAEQIENLRKKIKKNVTLEGIESNLPNRTWSEVE